jgi:hypothetical protein
VGGQEHAGGFAIMANRSEIIRFAEEKFADIAEIKDNPTIKQCFDGQGRRIGYWVEAFLFVGAADVGENPLDKVSG